MIYPPEVLTQLELRKETRLLPLYRLMARLIPLKLKQFYTAAHCSFSAYSRSGLCSAYFSRRHEVKMAPFKSLPEQSVLFTIHSWPWLYDWSCINYSMYHRRRILSTITPASREQGRSLLQRELRQNTSQSQPEQSELKSLNNASLKRVDDVKYLGSHIIFFEKDSNICKALEWDTCNNLDEIWRSNLLWNPNFSKSVWTSATVWIRNLDIIYSSFKTTRWSIYKSNNKNLGHQLAIPCNT